MFGYVKALVSQLKNDRRGVTMIEYAVLGALICGVAIAAIPQLGTVLTTAFSDIGSKITTAQGTNVSG